jgi:hypothetical protein
MKSVLFLLVAVMLSGCHKCPAGGFSATCGDYPRDEDEQYQQEYEQKGVDAGVNKGK